MDLGQRYIEVDMGYEFDDWFIEELKSIPICIITGQPELRKLIYDRADRMPEGYVDKPISEENLLLNIRKILELKHTDKAIK